MQQAYSSFLAHLRLLGEFVVWVSALVVVLVAVIPVPLSILGTNVLTPNVTLGYFSKKKKKKKKEREREREREGGGSSVCLCLSLSISLLPPSTFLSLPLDLSLSVSPPLSLSVRVYTFLALTFNMFIKLIPRS